MMLAKVIGFIGLCGLCICGSSVIGSIVFYEIQDIRNGMGNWLHLGFYISLNLIVIAGAIGILVALAKFMGL